MTYLSTIDKYNSSFLRSRNRKRRRKRRKIRKLKRIRKKIKMMVDFFSELPLPFVGIRVECQGIILVDNVKTCTL